MALIKFEGKPIEKLIETVSQGIGILYEPTRIKKLANADAYRYEKMEEAKAKGLILMADTENELLIRAKQRLTLQEIDRQINIDNIVQKSVDALEDSVSETPVDPDWRSKFFNKAQDISSDELQEVWAKILANEITSPGNVSLRSLEVLSSLSKAEALIFSKVAKLSFSYGSIYKLYSSQDIKEFNLTFNDILELSACGLMYDNTSLNITYNIEDSQRGVALFFGNTIVFCNKENAQTITFDQFKLTPMGAELANALKIEKDYNYLDAFISKCKEDGYIITK
ncbi:DUF2806 domain-containing protein [Sphingobacterium faecium]|uniref:DUF2806 domain-containing protein n=1 Tax=Sphingobacterium faecium TaxID=34087 RepID=UPI00320851B3